jgi:FtsP/CotA-like multicopper oxidase with cupredoxin domain
VTAGHGWLPRSASVLCLAVAAHTGRTPPPAGVCATTVNYCAELVPTPGYYRAAAVLELEPVPSPFDVAVTRDGNPRYQLVISIAGLPRASHDGRPSRAYVAWMTTLGLDSVVKLGTVRDGRTILGETTRDQFRVLISAESSAAVGVRSGPLVFRGTSPDSRLLAHRDAVSPFLAATMMSPAMAMPGMASGAMPDMEPDIAPFLPAPDGVALPSARPREAVRLKSGDTLSLTAMRVRRTVAGRMFTAYAYNGEIPGPLIEVNQGTEIVVQFHNTTDLPSAVHWHGIRLDSASDGAVGISQAAVAPGGSFTYRVRFPDAGIYWYHSHEREDIQQPLGLYGNIIVRPRGAPALPVNAERILAVGDMLLADSAPVPFGATGPTHVLMGRFGNVMLINGSNGYQDTVPRGAVVRYYLTNVANARVLNLAFGGARVKVVAADAGAFAGEVWANSVVIAPAERYVVDVRFPDTGSVTVTNRVQALDHLTGALHAEIDTMGVVYVAPGVASPDHAGAFGVLRRDEPTTAGIARYRREFTRPADRILTLEMRVTHLPPIMSTMLGGPSVPVEWNDGMGAMNRTTTSNDVTWVIRDSATGKENMDIAWRFHEGDVVKVRIYNNPVGPHAMDHPIHLHGQRMLVLARNGVANPYLAWKDTALIPAGQVTDLLLDLSNPGTWMLHCHIAEHRGAQMMMVLSVQPRRRSREIRAAS